MESECLSCEHTNFYCMCVGKSALRCFNHLEAHSQHCEMQKFELCRLWISRNKPIKAEIPLGLAMQDSLKYLQEQYCPGSEIFGVYEGNLLDSDSIILKNGKSRKKKLTFFRASVARHRTRLTVSFFGEEVSGKFKLIKTIESVKIRYFELFDYSNLYELAPKIPESFCLLETNVRSFQVFLKPVKQELIESFNISKNSEEKYRFNNPFLTVSLRAQELVSNRSLFSVLNQLAALELADIKIVKEMEILFNLDCLVDPKITLGQIMEAFRTTIFDSLFRPLNFKKLIKFIEASAAEKLLQKLKKYIKKVTFISYTILSEGLGILKSTTVSSKVLSLTKSILLSKPSVNAMQLIHPSLDFKDFIISTLRYWKRCEKLYLWDQSDKTEYLFEAMSGVDGNVYLSEVFYENSEFEQSVILAHEVQHLMSRTATLLYSPLKFVQSPRLNLFFKQYNHGMPLEAGNLYWAMMTKVIGTTGADLERIIGQQAYSKDFWNSIDESSLQNLLTPLNSEHRDIFFSDLPFSFKFRSNKKKRGWVFM